MKWKDIKGFEGYQVSDTGLVRTHDKVTHTSRCTTRHWKDRILKPKRSKKAKRNQERVDLWKDGVPYGFLVARLVAFTFYDEDIFNRELTVNHIDGNWRNNNLQNLELISLQANIKHGFENGLFAAMCHPIKLTNKQTGETIICRSEAEAGRKMGMSCGYVHSRKQRGLYENDKYFWEPIPERRAQ